MDLGGSTAAAEVVDYLEARFTTREEGAADLAPELSGAVSMAMRINLFGALET
jgi:hypothetical protein